MNLIRIDLDDIKFNLFGKNIMDSQLTRNNWNSIYQKMYHLIEKNLKAGRSVINDTGNFTLKERNMVKKIADKFNIPSITVFVDTPERVAIDRLMKNKGERFPVTVEEFESAVSEMEPPEKEENHVVYHSDQDINKFIKIITGNDQKRKGKKDSGTVV